MAGATNCLPYARKRGGASLCARRATKRKGADIEPQGGPPTIRWTRLDAVALATVVAAAALVRLVALSRPVELVFDEIFYARNACWYVYASEATCGVSGLASRAHPPLGNWLVASGIGAFGYEPFGWRVAAAVAGILAVATVYVLAWRLLRVAVPGRGATVGAIAASGLLALDFLHVVHSRVGMLDAFLALFATGAVLFIVLDRDRERDRVDAPWWWQATMGRPWRLLAGVCLGAALGVKWSGLYVAPAIIGLVTAWEIADQRRRQPDGGWARVVLEAVRREALPTFVLLGIVPLLVYVAGYIGRMPGELIALPWDPASVWRGIWEHQSAMLDFHTGDSPTHPYQSPPWAWPLLKRPVAYWFAQVGPTYREILALGNPLAWWPGLLALGALALTWWRARLRLGRPEPVILAAAVATFLPWLILAGSGQAFIWYFLPTVPFLCLALGCFVAWSWERTAGRVAAIVYGVLILASFAVYVPLLTALPLDPEGWRMRILFAECERPDGTTQELPDDTVSEGNPPRGWCWI
jgi:dolichyl-phosphate-mannose-protein mannosyltransferase